MSALELKNEFHSLIDSINNEALLSKFYALLKRAKESKQGQLWATLSDEDQQELLLAEMESQDESQLISNEDMKKKYSKWL